jgi:hypothetical protein
VSAGGVAVSACAHDDSTIFVRQVLAPQSVAAGQQCIFTPDPTQPFLSSGTLDFLLRPEYDAMFLVANQMVPRGDPNAPATETSFVTLQGAEVRILDSMGNTLNAYTRLSTATIPPSQGTAPTYTPIGPVAIVDQTTASKLNLAFGAVRRVVTFTKFFGKTLGGQYVESNEYEFPVDVCSGCLIGFSAADVNPNYTTPNCLGNPGSMSSMANVPCFPGQDAIVDCSICRAAGIPECNPNAQPIQDAGGGGG